MPFISTMSKMVKTSYGALKKLNIAKAAYIAGFIDGDGTVSLTRIHRNEHRRLSVTIGNNNSKLLEWVKKSVGAGQVTKKRPDNKRHATSYTYRICGRQAFNLLTQITPYLKTHKQKRAKLILRHYIKLTPRNGKYSPKLLEQRKKFIKDFFSIPCSGTIKINPRNSPFIQKILKTVEFSTKI